MSLLIVGCVFAVFGLTFLVLLKVYATLTLGKCHSTRKLYGKTALVTGSNRGIGYMTALNLAKRGARVIITSENMEDLKKAQKKMIQKSGNNNIVAKKLDFLYLDQVRAFAKDILATEDRLDILVNNAGTSGLGKNYTKDGLLAGMQVNYFGPFLLTNLLLDLMKKSAPSRIVNVASTLGNNFLWFNPSNINGIKQLPLILYEFAVYSNSKRCMILSAMEMAERLKENNVTVNCLHPGGVYTKIYEETKIDFLKKFIDFFGPIYLKTPEEGAQTSIHLAACERAEGITGCYFSDCRKSSIWGNMSRKIRSKVWNSTIELLKMQPNELFI